MSKRSVITNLIKCKIGVYFRFEVLKDSINVTVSLIVVLSLLTALITVFMFFRVLTSPPVSRVQLYIPEVCDKRKCVDTDETLSAYLLQVVQKQYKQMTEEKARDIRELLETGTRIRLGIDQSNDYLEDTKPAGKLVGKEKKRSTRSMIIPSVTVKSLEEATGNKSKIMIPVRRWLKERESYNSTGFLRFGIKQYNGRLVVPVTGTYSIYSYIEYTEYTDKTSFKHEICRYRLIEDYLAVISSGQKRYTSTRRDSRGIVGSYIFVVADLRAGDQLSVRVNDMMGLQSLTNNFFGLNLI